MNLKVMLLIVALVIPRLVSAGQPAHYTTQQPHQAIRLPEEAQEPLAIVRTYCKEYRQQQKIAPEGLQKILGAISTLRSILTQQHLSQDSIKTIAIAWARGAYLMGTPGGAAHVLESYNMSDIAQCVREYEQHKMSVFADSCLK